MLRIVMCFACLGYFSSCRLIPLELSEGNLTEKQVAVKKILKRAEQDQAVTNDLYQNGLFAPQLYSQEYLIRAPHIE